MYSSTLTGWNGLGESPSSDTDLDTAMDTDAVTATDTVTGTDAVRYIQYADDIVVHMKQPRTQYRTQTLPRYRTQALPRYRILTQLRHRKPTQIRPRTQLRTPRTHRTLNKEISIHSYS